MNQPWQIELLGRLRVARADREITRFQTQKTGALLAYLAFFCDRPHPREDLIQMLWPQSDLESGRNRLRVALTSLRRQLEPSGQEAGTLPNPKGAVLVADRHTVRLNPAAVITDVARFEEAVEACRSAPPRLDRLLEAVGLYQGELLPGYCEEWVLPERQRLAAAFLQVVRDLVPLLVAKGEVERGLDLAYHAVAADPFWEEGHRLVIHLLASLGRVSAARRHYEDLKRLLAREGAGEPEPETRALMASLPAGTPPVPRSTAAPDKGSPQPPLALAESSRPSETEGLLPLTFTRLFGRQNEITELIELLLARQTLAPAAQPFHPRLITLTGPGGSGKTRLAIEVARRLRDRFDGAVWFVPLADLAQPERLPATLRDTLLLPCSTPAQPIGQILTALAHRPALLLLDNFEHLLPDGQETLCFLLARLPRLTCLVTSRQRLNLPGEREYPVAPLPLPMGWEGPEGSAERTALLACPSVQLFVDRAQAVRPDFQVTASNAAAVAALCARLEGLPLSIELAAARAGVLSPAQMLAQLAGPVYASSLLVSRQRNVAPRHQSLRAALDWSQQSLSPRLQRFFAQLSIFRGGWSLEAAEAVCSGSLDLLEELRERSLLILEEEGEGLRYRMLEVLREYASEQLKPGEREGAALRHARYFAELVEAVEPHLYGADPGGWLDQLEVEHNNLRAALEWTMGTGQGYAGVESSSLALRLGAALGRFWWVRGYWVEARARLEAILAGVPVQGVGANHPAAGVRARAQAWAGKFAFLQGDCVTARRLYEDALRVWEPLGDRVGIAAVCLGLGQVAHFETEFAKARQLYEQSLAAAREAGNTRQIAAALDSLGRLARARNDYAAARRFAVESIFMWREAGEALGLIHTLNFLGEISYFEGDYSAARESLEEGLKMAQALRDQQAIAWLLNLLGDVARCQDDYCRAEALYKESVAIYRELDKRGAVAGGLGCLGYIGQRHGHGRQAAARFAEALGIHRREGNRRGIALCLEGLAGVAVRAGRAKMATRLFGAAEALREAIGAEDMWPAHRRDYEHNVALLRATLEEQALATEWSAGRALPVSEAIAVALEVACRP